MHIFFPCDLNYYVLYLTLVCAAGENQEPNELKWLNIEVFNFNWIFIIEYVMGT